MSTKPHKPALWLALITAALCVIVVLAACARLAQPGPGQPAQPTGIAPTSAAPTAQPTGAAQATAQPTSAAPTAQPAQPVIGFRPEAGGPGTSVEISGSGYTPGKWYVVRLGLPQPMGEALFSAQASADGRWGGRFNLPANVPSGEPIPSGQIFLVVMDEQNKALASAPFAFDASAIDASAEAVRVVSAMLDAHMTGKDVRPFLTSVAREEIDGGSSLAAVLGLKAQAPQSYTIGQPQPVQGADGLAVPAALNYGGSITEYSFTVVWGGAQLIDGGVITKDQPAAYPETPEALIVALLEAFAQGGDLRPYLGQNLLDKLDAGQPVHQVLGLHPVALLGHSFGEPYSYPAADLAFMPVNLSYQGFSEDRVFTVGIDYANPSPLRAKIYGSELAREGRPVASGPEDLANRFLLEIWAERSGRLAMPYLAGELRERLIRGEQLDLLEQGATGPMLALSSYAVRSVVAEDATYKWVEIALDLEGQPGLTRFVKTQQVDGIWQVVGVINDLASEPPPSAFPGPGWAAWKSGDFNGDGIEETVYLKETDLIGHDRLSDPLLNSDSRNATAVMVVQAAAHGPWVMLEVDSQSARTSDGHTMPFVSEAAPNGPTFFQVAITYAYEGRFLHLLPLKGDGYAHTQAIAFKWNPAASAYRLIGGPHGEW